MTDINNENLLNLDKIQALEKYIAYKNNKELQDWFVEFSNERFIANLNTFKKYHKEVFSLIENYDFSTKLELFCNEKGFANIFYSDYSDFLYKTADSLCFCSSQTKKFVNKQVSKIKADYQNDPYGQLHFKYLNSIISKRQTFSQNSFSLENSGSVPLLLFLGVGLGYQIAETFEKIESKNVIIIEPELDLFFASLFVFDWENLLVFFAENSIRARFILGDYTDHVLLYLSHFFAHHGSFLASGLTVYKHYSSKKTDLIEYSIQSNLSFFLSVGFFDSRLFGLSHSFDNLSKGKQFVKAVNINEYESTPVFIIGAGPSLDNNISFLRKFQDKAIIIACGTAIDSLYHAGIQPDFYANTERVPEISQALELIPDKSFLRKTILLATCICSPKVASFFEVTALFDKKNELYISFLSNFVEGLKKVKSIEGINPLVGNMGVSGALHLGFNKLYLFGLDNGRNIGENFLHSKYTSLYRKASEVDNGTLDCYEDGNFGGKIKTNSLYKECAYRISQTLESFLREKEIICFNCSDGLAINNTIPKRDYDLVAEFEKLPSLSKDLFHSYFKENIIRQYDFSIDSSCIELIKLKFKELTREIDGRLKTKYVSRIDCINTLESVSEYLSELLVKNNFYASCINGSLQMMFVHIIGQLYSTSDEKKCLEQAEELILIIKDFLAESAEVFCFIPDYILGEHKKYYPDGKVGKDMPHCKATLFPSSRKVVQKAYEDPQKEFKKLYE